MDSRGEQVSIDGARGEGGGQIVRTGVSLSAMTGRTVEIVNIRAGRSKPGLQAQHLTSVLAAAGLCDARLEGAELNSQRLRFVPGPPVTQRSFAFDVARARNGASAGATGLVAQTLLVPMSLLTTERVEAAVLGGTHVPMAPPTDYIESVYLPMLRLMGCDMEAETRRAGFFPRGGGELRLVTQGGGPRAALDCVERGRLLRLRAHIVTSDLPAHVADRAGQTLMKALRGYGVPLDLVLRDLPSHGAGAAVVLTSECERSRSGWTALGERGKPMERVTEEAIRRFQRWYGSAAAVDEHLADQLVLPCALIPEESRWTVPEVTEHLRTVLEIVQLFLPIWYEFRPISTGCTQVSLRGVSLQ